MQGQNCRYNSTTVYVLLRYDVCVYIKRVREREREGGREREIQRFENRDKEVRDEGLIGIDIDR